MHRLHDGTQVMMFEVKQSTVHNIEVAHIFAASASLLEIDSHGLYVFVLVAFGSIASQFSGSHHENSSA